MLEHCCWFWTVEA